MNNAAGSEIVERRFHGHRVSGPGSAMVLFSQLASTTQASLIREAQHFGVTKVILEQTAWELAFRPDHSFELRSPGERGWL